MNDNYTRKTYNIPVDFRRTKKMEALLDAGGAKFYGLYMYLYDYSLMVHGIVCKDILSIKAKKLGIIGKHFALFLEIALREGLLIYEQKGNWYVMPQVQQQLEWAKERKLKTQKIVKNYWNKHRKENGGTI